MKNSQSMIFFAAKCFTVFTVLWLEFSTPGSPDVLSITTSPKKNNFILISPQNYAISLWANQCVPWPVLTDSVHAIFFNNGALRGLFTSTKHLLTVYLRVILYYLDLSGGDDWLNLCHSSTIRIFIILKNLMYAYYIKSPTCVHESTTMHTCVDTRAADVAWMHVRD